MGIADKFLKFGISKLKPLIDDMIKTKNLNRRANKKKDDPIGVKIKKLDKAINDDIELSQTAKSAENRRLARGMAKQNKKRQNMLKEKAKGLSTSFSKN